MPFTEGALHEAVLTETQQDNNGQLICQDIVLDPTQIRYEWFRPCIGPVLIPDG
jgi:hypothetical protein